MTVGFLRHAEAEDGNGTDFDRHLTPKGFEQAGKVAKFFLHSELYPDLIITSPLVRAHQTAEVVAEAIGCEMITAQWLSCGMEPAECLAGLAATRECEFVLLVGHEPDFSCTMADLLGMPDPSAIKVRKASLSMLELAEFRPGCGQLQFSLPARLMN